LINVSELLSLHGYEVFSAADGLQGLITARAIIPDIIVSDVMMPGLDGFQLKDALEKHSETAMIPFIFLTARADGDDIRMGMNLGAEDYLVKPFKAKDLVNSIEARIRKSETMQKLFKPQEKKLKADEKIFIEYKGKPSFLKVSDIKFIQADGAYTKIQSSEGKMFHLRRLIKEWEELLPDDSFLRIHRSVIINLKFVSKVEKWFNRSYKIFLEGVDNPFDISRDMASKMKKEMKI